MSLILGVDPGKATGIAVYDLETCKPILMHETANGVLGFVEWDMLTPGHHFQLYDHKACENFTLRSSNKFTADLSGVEIIGYLKANGYLNAKRKIDSFPEPIQHMQLTRLRKNKDDYAKSPVTKLMKECGFKIGEGHTRMALSVAVWYAAKVLIHRPTLEMLKPKDS